MKIKIFGLLLGLLFLVTLPLQAQKPQTEGPPKAELFAGFSYVNADFDILGRQNFVGWETTVSGNLTKGFSLVADFGGQYASILTVNVQVYEALFGPRFTNRTKKVTAFSHTLAGIAHTRAVGVSSSDFALIIGGGLDVNVSDHIAIRVLQIDWAQVFSEGEKTDNARFAFGVVFKFGGR